MIITKKTIINKIINIFIEYNEYIYITIVFKDIDLSKIKIP